MIIVYSPEGGEERRFDMKSVRTSEAQIVERTTDMKWGEIKLGVRDDDPTALRGIAWVLLKRVEPTLRWSEFDPLTSELASRFDEAEVGLFAADILKLPEEKQSQAIEELRMYAADAGSVDVALKVADQPPKEATLAASQDDASDT